MNPSSAHDELAATLPDSRRGLLLGALRQLFGPLEEAELDRIVSNIGLVTVARGTTLYMQGDPGDSMHVLLTGRLQVRVRTDDGGARILAHPIPGETVGEMALLTGARRAATIAAVRDSTLGVLTRQAFDEVIARHPEVLSHITRMIIGRITDTQGRISVRTEARTIAVVPLHANIDRAAFCRQLRLALLRFGSVAHIDRATIDYRFPAGAKAADALERDRFLDDCERTHDYVLLEAENTASAWTRKCIGYADRILLVASAEALPEVTPLERELFDDGRLEGHVQPELALAYAADTRPAGTRQWLHGRRITRHYHVPLRSSEGFNRLARFLVDRAVALVLAGGGARGFAHLGVIRALSEAGIPVDAIGGTSFGALAATGPARGFEIEHMMEELRFAFSNERPLDDYTLPIVSLVRGDKLDQLLRKYLDMDIEDLWIPYFAVSSNLSENRIEVHDRGTLWSAVRASVSLPGILPPLLHNGSLLIDGGVLNNLPVDVMRDKIRGRIIAVDLSVEHEYRLEGQTIPSGYEYLKSRLLPWVEPIEAPTLARVLMKTTTLASRREVELARKTAHLYMNVPLAEYDLMDWARFHEIVEAGYRFANRTLLEFTARDPDIVQRDSALQAFSRAAAAGS